MKKKISNDRIQFNENIIKIKYNIRLRLEKPPKWWWMSYMKLMPTLIG